MMNLKNVAYCMFIFIVFCNNIYSQNRNLDKRYKEIEDTNKKEMYLMIDFLIKNETDFTITTDINYLLDLVYKKNQAFFNLHKLYLKEKYCVEAYLFNSTSSHSDSYIMLYSENEVIFLGKGKFEEDLNSFLIFIDKNVNPESKFSFVQKVSSIFAYMVNWNYRLE